MKTALLCSMLVLGGAFCYGETVLSLSFPAREFKPSGKMTFYSKLDVTEANFVKIADKKYAFRLSDENMKKKQTPNFAAGSAFPYKAGSVEITFKVLKQVPGSKARLLHVFSPAKNDAQALLIHYFFVNEKGALNVFIQCRNKQYKVLVPARLIDNTKFNTVKAAWNARELTVFLNGKKVESAPLPKEYAVDAAKPRGWSSFGLLQMVIADKDNWNNRIAIADVKVETAK